MGRWGCGGLDGVLESRLVIRSSVGASSWLSFAGAGAAGAGASTLCCFWCRCCDDRHPRFWRRGERGWLGACGCLFQDLGDLDVRVGDVGAISQGRDEVGRFVLDEGEQHVSSGLAQVFFGGDFGKRNVVGKPVDG